MRVVTLLFAVAACEASQAGPLRSASYDHEAVVRFHMREHYDMFDAIQLLAIRNNVYEVRALARTIGGAVDERGLDKWATQIAAVRARASQLASAPGSDEACRRTARLAGACARCHIDANVVPIFGTPPPVPAGGTSNVQRMARHVWAIDRLAEGMIGGVNDSWLAGLDALAQTAAPFSVADADRAALARRLQDLADQTRKHVGKDDLEARTHAYGELLVTCSACHADDQRTAK